MKNRNPPADRVRPRARRRLAPFRFGRGHTRLLAAMHGGRRVSKRSRRSEGFGYAVLKVLASPARGRPRSQQQHSGTVRTAPGGGGKRWLFSDRRAPVGKLKKTLW